MRPANVFDVSEGRKFAKERRLVRNTLQEWSDLLGLGHYNIKFEFVPEIKPKETDHYFAAADVQTDAENKNSFIRVNTRYFTSPDFPGRGSLRVVLGHELVHLCIAETLGRVMDKMVNAPKLDDDLKALLTVMADEENERLCRHIEGVLNAVPVR